MTVRSRNRQSPTEDLNETTSAKTQQKATTIKDRTFEINDYEKQKYDDYDNYEKGSIGVREEYLGYMKLYGYCIILVTGLFFVISMGTILNLWQWCFKVRPDFILQLKSTMPMFSTMIDKIIEQNEVLDNYYIFALILNFVVLWIWAVVSWISMKLFRHSKGGGS